MNYRPVSILYVTGKIFKKLLSEKVTSLTDEFFLKFNMVFRRVIVHSTAC